MTINMSELTLVTLCQALANLTNNRCNLVDNPITCRCIIDNIHPISSPVGVSSTAPDIMLSEVFLIFFVLAIWLSAIGFCLSQYKSLRRLETQVHYCVSRKDPLNIGEIKIVTREQDSIIYKKKRYSTVLDTHINPQDLKAMQYVQQYLPKTNPSTLSAIVINQDDISTRFNSTNNILLSTHREESEEELSIPHFKTDIESNKHNTRIPFIQRAGSARYTAGLTVPHISPSNSFHSSWNETCSTQHLSVPSNNLGSNCYSVGNISLTVPQIISKPSGEELLDPRLIPETVRRSLLALHRESQENVNVFKKKHQTQSENDVHGVLIPLKQKMHSKLNHTHTRQHSNTLSNSHLGTNSNDYNQRTIQKENQSTTNPIIRRSLKNFPKYLTESTTESDTTPGD